MPKFYVPIHGEADALAAASRELNRVGFPRYEVIVYMEGGESKLSTITVRLESETVATAEQAAKHAIPDTHDYAIGPAREIGPDTPPPGPLIPD